MVIAVQFSVAPLVALSFTLDGPPVPKQRAREGKGGHWYTPEATQRYEASVRTAAMVAKHLARRSSSWPKGARYALTVRAYFPDRRRADADNVLKAVADACNGMLWDDDSQIDDTHAYKRVDRDRPRTEITVEVLGDETT